MDRGDSTKPPRVWNAAEYDAPRRRLVPCFDEFYGALAELVVRSCPARARVLDLGSGTGLLAGTIAERLPAASFTLLDASPDMLGRAEERMAERKPRIIVASLTEALPAGPFDAIVSSLAIHHLADDEKRALYAAAVKQLDAGGVLLNGDQIAAPTAELNQLYRELHLARARSLGSDEAEVAAAVERMQVDRNARLEEQLEWLSESGLEAVDCFFRWYGFAVFGGWKREGERL